MCTLDIELPIDKEQTMHEVLLSNLGVSKL